MNLFILLLTSIGVNLDVFSLSFASALLFKKTKILKLLKLPLSFLISHLFFTFIGWVLGNSLKNIISQTDHWIAFTLLVFIGIKVLFEKNKKELNKNFLKFKNLATLSIAIGIDTFAIGISFSFLKQDIVSSLFVIGLTTLIFSLLGIILSKYFSKINPKYLNLIAGTILILIGTKILIEHLIS